MHKPSSVLIYGGLGLTAFGVAYDSGWLGRPDGHDHSAIVAIPAATGTVSLSNGVLVAMNNITGDEIVTSLSGVKPPQHQT
jgi:hypothetical protein